MFSQSTPVGCSHNLLRLVVLTTFFGSLNSQSAVLITCFGMLYTQSIPVGCSHHHVHNFLLFLFSFNFNLILYVVVSIFKFLKLLTSLKSIYLILNLTYYIFFIIKSEKRLKAKEEKLNTKLLKTRDRKKYIYKRLNLIIVQYYTWCQYHSKYLSFCEKI